MENYLNTIHIQSNYPLQPLLQTLPTISSLEEMCAIIKQTVEDTHGWIDCKRPTCFDTCYFNVMTEINSTAYYLRCLTNSLLNTNYIISFNINNPLTGLWKDDYPFITFDIKKDGTIIHSNGRLIMGFGPSSSGKTYCAKQIIELLHLNNPQFPNDFLSIDGGIYRESSVVYQIIIACIQNSHGTGFKNLVSTNIFSKSIFNTNYIKKYILNFLIYLNKKINLYVPETLGGCVYCKSKYTNYIKLTGDINWIGIVIWQHKTSNDCDYDKLYGPQFKCTGCTESGKLREIKEGKKYSNATYHNSFKNSFHAMKQANLRYAIHNSGDPNRWSILEDYSNTPLSIPMNYLNSIKWKYIKKTKTIKNIFNLIKTKKIKRIIYE